MTSPWKKIATVEPANLSDIMSEELVKDMLSKSYAKEAQRSAHVGLSPRLLPDTSEGDTNASAMSQAQMPFDLDSDQIDTCSDELIALHIQHQYDEEYNDYVNRYETKMNGTSNVRVSLKNYLRETLDEDDYEEEELEDLREDKDWDRFDAVLRKINNIPACGYVKQQDGNLVTKHDIKLSGQKNMLKIMEYEEFASGDGGANDYKLSNKVFNSLKRHIKNEQSKKPKFHDKKDESSTQLMALDFDASYRLYKLITTNIVKTIDGVISSGKEAIVLRGTRDDEVIEPHIKDCAIKVFKTTLSKFKNRGKYIKEDYRFKDQIGRQKMNKVMNLWTEKEKQNLLRMKKAGIPCPEVVGTKNNILIMSLIGDKGIPAPNLKFANLKYVDCELAYAQVCTLMNDLYKKANLVHADLSEYNILWYKNQCYFIDVGQAIIPTCGEHFMYLYRDCVNVIQFFKREGIPDIQTPEELFEAITDLSYVDKVSWDNKVKPHHLNNPEYDATEAEFL